MIVDYLLSREAPGKEYTLVKPLMLPLSSFEIWDMKYNLVSLLICIIGDINACLQSLP